MGLRRARARHLNSFDGETGDVVYDGGTGSCAGVHQFTELIAANGRLLTAGDAAGQAHLCYWVRALSKGALFRPHPSHDQRPGPFARSTRAAFSEPAPKERSVRG